MKWTSTAVPGCFSSSSWTQQPYYADLIWPSSPWHWSQNVRWHSYLNSRGCRESQVTGCHCSGFLDVSAFLSLSAFLFSSRIIKPCLPFWKLYFHSPSYCRLKAGALEGYQLINKLQSSHLVRKLLHWSKWKFRPLAFKWQFLKVWMMCLWDV